MLEEASSGATLRLVSDPWGSFGTVSSLEAVGFRVRLLVTGLGSRGTPSVDSSGAKTESDLHSITPPPFSNRFRVKAFP